MHEVDKKLTICYTEGMSIGKRQITVLEENGFPANILWTPLDVHKGLKQDSESSAVIHALKVHTNKMFLWEYQYSGLVGGWLGSMYLTEYPGRHRVFQ